MATSVVSTINPLGQTEFPTQSANFTGTAAHTTGWSQGPEYVSVWATNACYVQVGSGVTATSGSIAIPTNVMVILRVPINAKDGWYVSAVRVTDSGTIYVTPVGG